MYSLLSPQLQQQYYEIECICSGLGGAELLSAQSRYKWISSVCLFTNQHQHTECMNQTISTAISTLSIHHLHTIYTLSTQYLHKNCMNQIIRNNMNTVFRSCTDRTEHHGHLNDRQIEKCWIKNYNSWSIQSGTLQNKNVWFLKLYENSLVVQSKIWWEIDSVKIWKLSLSGVGCML